MPNGRGYELTFGGVSSTTFPWLGVEVVRRRMFGSNRDVLRETGGREGAWRFGEKRGLRVMEIVCWSLSGSYPVERREDIVAVADWLDGGFKPLIIGDEPDRYYMAMMVGEVEMDEWRERGHFTLEFLTEPYAYSNDVSTETWAAIDGVAHTWTPEDTVIAYPVVELSPNSGLMSSFALTFNDLVMTFTGEIASSTFFTINSIAYVALEGANTDTELNGEFDPTIVDMQDVSGAFPALLPSQEQSVTLEWEGTASTVDMNVYWRRRYR